MREILKISLLLVVAALVSSCSSTDFRVRLALTGLGNQNLHILYVDDSGAIVDTWQSAKEDRLEISGKCADPSLMLVYNSMNVQLLRLAVSPGDKIEVEGKVLNPLEAKVKGSKTMEQWSDFVTKHKNEYQMPNKQALNQAIEKFVADNPKSVVSTLLLIADYSPADDAQVTRLLDKIDNSAKPQSLLATLSNKLLKQGKPLERITGLNMLELGGDFATASFQGHRRNVLFFWDDFMKPGERAQVVEELKMLAAAQDVNIVDINLNADTTGWATAAGRDGNYAKHYWMPGAVMNRQITKLQIRTTPTLIVSDSTGHQLYRGNDAIKARQTAEN